METTNYAEQEVLYEILRKLGYNISPFTVTEITIILKCMQEYSLHSKQQARVEAIQECIEAIKENFQWLQAGGWSKAEICQVLETLKSRQ